MEGGTDGPNYEDSTPFDFYSIPLFKLIEPWSSVAFVINILRRGHGVRNGAEVMVHLRDFHEMEQVCHLWYLSLGLNRGE